MDAVREDRLLAGRYRLSEQLGSGGMGAVWAGRDELLRRPVAVKEVWPQGAPGSERRVLAERTRREARAAAAVASPSVMTVYDVVEEDEQTWIVMERLPPRTLADVIAEEGRLDPGDAAPIGLAVLDALDAAHAVGVLHRDVKPGNVMWGPGGRVVLADFGIAQTPDDTAITQTGMVLGSPAYLAPERARGGRATPASDLWALGALLYAAVEGHPPFEGGGALGTLTSVVVDDVPPAPHAGPLAPVVEGLLDKDPVQRMTSAQARPLLVRAVRRAPDPTLVSPLAAEDPAPAAAHTAPTTAATPAPAARTPAPAVAPAPPAAPSAAPGPPSGRWRRGLVLAAVLVVLAVLAVVAVQLSPGGSGSGSDPTARGAPATSAPASPTASAPRSPAPQTSRPPSTSAASPPTSSAATTQAPATQAPAPSASPSSTGAVPAGLQTRTDPTGFSVALPAGWTEEREGTQVRWRDPASSRYLLVDQTTDPASDALVDWQEYEPTVRARFPGYQRVRLERIRVPGAQDAADLEFTFGTGARTHVIDRNLLIGPDRAYALYWSAPDATWPQQRRLFDQIAGTFTPAS